MAREVVPTAIPRRLNRPVGANIAIVNQSATDVYVSDDYNQLASSAAGAVPNGGIKLAASGGGLIVNSFKLLWMRAAADTFVEVTP